MRTIIKVLGIAVAAVAVIFAVAALLLWRLFDPDNVRDELEAFVTEHSGREFSINGDLALTLFPWLGIEMGQMRLGHTQGFGDGDFARVESAGARVRLLPLLRGRMEFGTVVLDGFELNLARAADGRDNWSDLPGVAPPMADAARLGGPAGAIDEPFFSEVDIAGIDIRDGIVFWRENLDEVRHVISDITVATGPIAAGIPVDIDLGLRWVGVQPAFTAQLDGRAAFVAEPDATGFRADGLRLKFRVEDGQSDERIGGDLRASAAFDNASGIFQLDNLRINSILAGFTDRAEPVDFAAVAPSIIVDTASWTADVREAATTIGGISARWHVSAENLTSKPLFAGTIAVADAPVDETLALFGLEHDAPLGDFNFDSEIQLEPLTSRVALTDFTGSLLDMAITGNIALSDTDIAGSLEAPTFDPGALFSVLPPDWPAGANITVIEQLALSADFTVDRGDGSVSVREFAISAPGATAAGNLERSGDGDHFNGRIVASGVDPEVLIAVFPNLLPDELGPERLGPLGIDTTFDYNAAGSVLHLDDFTASALGLRTSGDFTIRDPAGDPDVTGTLRVANFSPRSLLERFGRNVPPSADPAALREATLNADFSLGANRAELASLQARLDDSHVTGRFEVTDFTDPHFVFELDVDRINFDRYLPPTSGAPTAPDRKDRGFGTAALANLNLAGRISASELQISDLAMADFSIDIHLAEGIVGIEPLEARLYGGKFNGAVQLDIRAGDPLASLLGSVRDVDMEGLLTALSGEPARIGGTGRMDVELTGIGGNLDEVLSTAVGSIDFSLRDGTLRGFNLDHTLCEAYNRLRGYPPPPTVAVSATSYSLMRGTAQVRDGIAQTTDVSGEATSIGVRGAGRVDLVSYGVDFDLEAEMKSPIAIQGCETLDGLVGQSIPVSVSGTVAEPQIGPNFEKLLRERLREEAGEAIFDAVIDLLN